MFLRICLGRDEGGCVHGAPVTDDQGILTSGHLLSHAEVGVLQAQHRLHQVLLKINREKNHNY